MRVLLADTFPDTFTATILERGHDYTYLPDITAEQLPERVPDHDVLVVRSTRVTAATLAADDRLRLVIRAGSGTNTIDRAAASERGIYIANVPGRNAAAVAELAFGLLLALDRRIVDGACDLRAGRWDKKRYGQARGVLGRRIGVVGLGWIGLAFAERAAAFGAHVHAVARSGRDADTAAAAARIGITFVEDLATLARECDVLSFHVPAGDSTRGIIGRELLEQVQPGTIILNTARGELIDEDALIEAMDAKGVRVGLDVYPDEPTTGAGEFDSALARHPNVYGTHHIGASTEQAQQAVTDEVIRMLDAFVLGEVPHCVNLAELEQRSSRRPLAAQTGATP